MQKYNHFIKISMLFLLILLIMLVVNFCGCGKPRLPAVKTLSSPDETVVSSEKPSTYWLSKDGDKLAFLTYEKGSATSTGLWWMKLDNPASVEQIHKESVRDAAWLANGKDLVFLTQKSDRMAKIMHWINKTNQLVWVQTEKNACANLDAHPEMPWLVYTRQLMDQTNKVVLMKDKDKEGAERTESPSWLVERNFAQIPTGWVTSPAALVYPDWKANNKKKLAYIDLDKEFEKKTVTASKDIDYAQPSHTGGLVAYATPVEGKDTGDLYLMDKDGKNETLVANDVLLAQSAAAWSPGDDKLAYIAGATLYIYDIQSKESRELVKDVDRLLEQNTWPTADKLYYQREADVYAIAPDGTGETCVFNAADMDKLLKAGSTEKKAEE